MKLRNVIGAALCAVALLTVGAALIPRYKAEYKLSTVVGPAFPLGQGAQIWADLVRERTQGRINIKIYPGMSLVQGDQTREFTAIRQGIIDMAVGSTINWSPQLKQLNLFSLPFLMPDYAAIDALVQGEVGQELFQLIDKAGVVPLAWGENGYRQISNSKREIRKPEDMNAMKVRVTGWPLYVNTFTELGARPRRMNWVDAKPALASGAVDGQENPLSIFIGAKLYNMGQKYLTLWNYVADPLIFVVNRKVWNSWTAQDQEIVRQAALDASKQEIALARHGVTGEDPSLLDEIRNHGVKVTELSQAEHDAFVAATKPVYEKWKKQIGEDLVNKAEQAIAARRHTPQCR
jgi:tripartite ATP-independent transporter DctP family solute receptor